LTAAVEGSLLQEVGDRLVVQKPITHSPELPSEAMAPFTPVKPSDLPGSITTFSSSLPSSIVPITSFSNASATASKAGSVAQSARLPVIHHASISSPSVGYGGAPDAGARPELDAGKFGTGLMGLGGDKTARTLAPSLQLGTSSGTLDFFTRSTAADLKDLPELSAFIDKSSGTPLMFHRHTAISEVVENLWYYLSSARAVECFPSAPPANMRPVYAAVALWRITDTSPSTPLTALLEAGMQIRTITQAMSPGAGSPAADVELASLCSLVALPEWALVACGDCIPLVTAPKMGTQGSERRFEVATTYLLSFKPGAPSDKISKAVRAFHKWVVAQAYHVAVQCKRPEPAFTPFQNSRFGHAKPIVSTWDYG
jgi:hypothetical protein